MVRFTELPPIELDYNPNAVMFHVQHRSNGKPFREAKAIAKELFGLTNDQDAENVVYNHAIKIEYVQKVLCSAEPMTVPELQGAINRVLAAQNYSPMFNTVHDLEVFLYNCDPIFLVVNGRVQNTFHSLRVMANKVASYIIQYGPITYDRLLNLVDEIFPPSFDAFDKDSKVFERESLAWGRSIFSSRHFYQINNMFGLTEEGKKSFVLRSVICIPTMLRSTQYVDKSREFEFAANVINIGKTHTVVRIINHGFFSGYIAICPTPAYLKTTKIIVNVRVNFVYSNRFQFQGIIIGLAKGIKRDEPSRPFLVPSPEDYEVPEKRTIAQHAQRVRLIPVKYEPY
ncbi:unnamed protein product [Caenorhabditis bovis]|uniref:Uncharacterized protein n=1 Tax=Caenorhabditis bovis TaxID=2654633 RepID=A0A8S1EV10_9PELO|nr:unnamed protein product [Caenorhabditis bovis]